MRKELEDRIADSFPFMKKGASLSQQYSAGYIDDLYSAFGLQCEDGWYDLIFDLCSEIMNAYREENRPIDLVVDEVKEKYGTLRLHYRITSGGEDFKNRISDIVMKYEEKSGTVCEMCGRPGVLRPDRGWIQTLCDCCAERN